MQYLADQKQPTPIEQLIRREEALARGRSEAELRREAILARLRELERLIFAYDRELEGHRLQQKRETPFPKQIVLRGLAMAIVEATVMSMLMAAGPCYAQMARSINDLGFVKESGVRIRPETVRAVMDALTAKRSELLGPDDPGNIGRGRDDHRDVHPQNLILPVPTDPDDDGGGGGGGARPERGDVPDGMPANTGVTIDHAALRQAVHELYGDVFSQLTRNLLREDRDDPAGIRAPDDQPRS